MCIPLKSLYSIGGERERGEKREGREREREKGEGIRKR